MHELSIAMSLIDLACEKATQLDVARIAAVHVRVGVRSGVVGEALSFSYEIAAEGTPLENSRLEIHGAPGEELELMSLEVVDHAVSDR
jgi:hydrogenase nickel incorporation protein HypA/HybF